MNVEEKREGLLLELNYVLSVHGIFVLGHSKSVYVIDCLQSKCWLWHDVICCTVNTRVTMG